MSLKSCSVLVAIALCLCTAVFAQDLDYTNNSESLPDTSIRSSHVVVVMEENRSINQASEYMPYLRSLAEQYSQGMKVYSDSHGSWLAYGELTSGFAPFNGSGDNGICNGDGCSQTITIDNLVRCFACRYQLARIFPVDATGRLPWVSVWPVCSPAQPHCLYNDGQSRRATEPVPLDPYLLQTSKIIPANFTRIRPT